MRKTVVLLAVAGIVMAGCGRSAESRLDERPSASPTSSFDAGPVRTYSNAKFGFSFDYPSGTSLLNDGENFAPPSAIVGMSFDNESADALLTGIDIEAHTYTDETVAASFLQPPDGIAARPVYTKAGDAGSEWSSVAGNNRFITDVFAKGTMVYKTTLGFDSTASSSASKIEIYNNLVRSLRFSEASILTSPNLASSSFGNKDLGYSVSFPAGSLVQVGNFHEPEKFFGKQQNVSLFADGANIQIDTYLNSVQNDYLKTLRPDKTAQKITVNGREGWKRSVRAVDENWFTTVVFFGTSRTYVISMDEMKKTAANAATFNKIVQSFRLAD